MGRARPNIYEVADRAAVSIATVSRVQRGSSAVRAETRRRVLAAIKELGYRPSVAGRALAERRHAAVAVVFPTLSGPYYAEVMAGCEDATVERGESLLILGTHRRPRVDGLVFDLAHRVDGLVVMEQTVDDEVLVALARDAVPLVLLGRPSVAEAPSVRSANAAPAVELTTHLIAEHGFERLAFIGDVDSAPDVAERWEGFVEAHRRARLEPPSRPVSAGFREADGFAVARAVFATGANRPQALVCANDELALGACRAARSLGLAVPDDVAVTGWDDVSLARLVPPGLTTVRQPMRELGAAAARLLFERIDAAAAQPASLVLPSELVIRSSCGCASEQDTQFTTDEGRG